MNATLTEEPRTAPAGSGRGWIAWLLVGLFVIGHIGCHGDEDTELGVAVPVKLSEEQ